MSDFVTLECGYCGNATRSSFIIRESEYICKCCGRAYRENPTGGETRAVIGFETLKNYDFAAAETIFSDVIRDYPESIDSRWGLLLARYGIVFVKGFYMGEIEPIYCFPNYGYKDGAFTAEEEYQEIMKLLGNDAERKALYQKQAEQIERAFGIFKEDVSNKENDVFLCVKISKTTANNPHVKGTTEDYEKACELYGKLREEGKSVFFSYVTLKNTIDSDMEIWRNLLRSKKMLLIGSRTEYMNSVWVKSEWERWIHMDNDGSNEHRKNLYIYILGNENENLYAKLPAGLKKLHPQIYTESTEADLINDVCYGGEDAEEKPASTAKSSKPTKSAASKPAKNAEPRKEAGDAENKDGYISFLSGGKETIAYGTQKLKDYSGRNDIARVVLPSSVTEIAKSNFSDCPNLAKIQIPASVTKIEKGAFSGCVKLASVEIPGGVTEIEANTFYMCKRLASVKFHAGVTKIGDLAFAQCESLKSVALPSGLMEIGAEAFNSTALRSVTVPRSVVSIGDRAFGGCKALEKVKIYDNVTSIGEEAFDWRNGLQITYSGTKDEFASAYQTYANKMAQYRRYTRYNGFELICERDPAVIKKKIWVGSNIFALLAIIIGAVVVAFTVKGGIHWSIGVAGGIILNMILGIITRRFSDTDTGLQFVMNIIELVACVILIPCAFVTMHVLKYAVGISLGVIIATVYLKITEDSEFAWIFIVLGAGTLLTPLAILTWSVLGLAIPLLVAGVGLLIAGIIWSIYEGSYY